MLSACAPRAELRTQDPGTAHAEALRRALHQGEAPPALPAEPKPAGFWRLASYGAYALCMLSAAGAFGSAASGRGPGDSGPLTTGLFAASGAFLGTGLAFSWQAHRLDAAKP